MGQTNSPLNNSTNNFHNTNQSNLFEFIKEYKKQGKTESNSYII